MKTPQKNGLENSSLPLLAVETHPLESLSSSIHTRDVEVSM